MGKTLFYLGILLFFITFQSCFSTNEVYKDLPKLEKHDFLELDRVHYLIDRKYNFYKSTLPDSLLNNPLSDTLMKITRSRIDRFLKIEDSTLVNEIQIELLKLESMFELPTRYHNLEIPQPIKVYMDSLDSDFLVLGWHFSCKKDINAQVKDATESIILSLVSMGMIIPIEQIRWTNVNLYLFDRNKNTISYYNRGKYSERLKISDKRLNKDIVRLLKKLYLIAI